MRKKLIFLHIPKNAGSTLRPVLRFEYWGRTIYTIGRGNGVDFQNLPAERRLKVDVLRGHCFYGIHEYLSGPSQYITMLRDPVDRALSLYYYARHTKAKGPFKSAAIAFSPLEFIRSGKIKELDNGQTRRISGEDPEFGSITKEHLDLAFANIDRNFAAVGVQDLYDESLILMANRLRWLIPPLYRSYMRNRSRPHAQVSATLKNEILEFNRFDDQLYRMCREKVASFASRPGARIQILLFKILNYAAAPMLLQPARWAWLQSNRRTRSPMRTNE